MQTEPNWSRNVNLRAHAWELEEFNKKKKFQIQEPAWVRFGKTQQQSIQPKTVHWIKQQNIVEKNCKNFELNENNLNYDNNNNNNEAPQQNVECQTTQQFYNNNFDSKQLHKDSEKINDEPNKNFITQTITTIRNNINGNVIQQIIQKNTNDFLLNNKQPQNQFKIISNNQKNVLNNLTQKYDDTKNNNFNQNQSEII